MSATTSNVLFVCTGNSARSILAEGLMNSLGKGRFIAYSAGSHPTGTVNPFALEALAELGVGTAGFRSKSWDEFALPGAPRLDFVFTVCDQAAGEVCPVWIGQPVTAHWGVADPAAEQGGDAAKRQRFRETAVILTRRIELMLALPLDRLEAMAIGHELRDIGRS